MKKSANKKMNDYKRHYKGKKHRQIENALNKNIPVGNHALCAKFRQTQDMTSSVSDVTCERCIKKLKEIGLI